MKHKIIAYKNNENDDDLYSDQYGSPPGSPPKTPTPPPHQMPMIDREIRTIPEEKPYLPPPVGKKYQAQYRVRD